MKATSMFAAVIWIFSLTAGFAQPRLSVGVNGGLQIIPSHESILPVIGVSTWFKASQSWMLNAEYLRHEEVDYYPPPPSGFLILPLHEESLTQRFSIGLHYPFKVYDSLPLNLLGISVGRSWDRRNYNLFEFPTEPPYDRVHFSENIQRSVLFFSLTALSQNKKLPFSLQARYGYSFSDISSWSLVESKSFWQVIAGVHLGVVK